MIPGLRLLRRDSRKLDRTPDYALSTSDYRQLLFALPHGLYNVYSFGMLLRLPAGGLVWVGPGGPVWVPR